MAAGSANSWSEESLGGLIFRLTPYYFLVSRFTSSSFPASSFSVFVPSPLASLRFGPLPCFLYTNFKPSRHPSKDRDKSCLPRIPFFRSLSEHGASKGSRNGTVRRPPRSPGLLHNSTRPTLLFLGVLPVPPRPGIPSLILALEQSRQLVISSHGASCADHKPSSTRRDSRTTSLGLLPSISSRNLPGSRAGRTPPAPPQSASLSTQKRVGSAQQAGVTLRTAPSRPPVRSVPGRPAAAALPETQLGSSHPSPCHASSSRSCPSLSTLTGTPGPSVRLSRSRHGAVTSAPCSGRTCQAQTLPPTMLPNAAEAASTFCASARHSPSAQANAADSAQAQYADACFSRLGSLAAFGSPGAVQAGALQL